MNIGGNNQQPTVGNVALIPMVAAPAADQELSIANGANLAAPDPLQSFRFVKVPLQSGRCTAGFLGSAMQRLLAHVPIDSQLPAD